MPNVSNAGKASSFSHSTGLHQSQAGYMKNHTLRSDPDASFSVAALSATESGAPGSSRIPPQHNGGMATEGRQITLARIKVLTEQGRPYDEAFNQVVKEDRLTDVDVGFLRRMVIEDLVLRAGSKKMLLEIARLRDPLFIDALNERLCGSDPSLAEWSAHTSGNPQQSQNNLFVRAATQIDQGASVGVERITEEIKRDAEREIADLIEFGMEHNDAVSQIIKYHNITHPEDVAALSKKPILNL
ncbi:hypothetical protein [Paraburkholderia sediminicola]|uniref:hypothetical protein n=1 Tax=Paraburkholderia sediminicola TaxID=458836 RepID=UPI0038B80A9B